MFIQYTNFLANSELTYLHNIAKNECENFPYIKDTHSKYQSLANMHIKYEQDKVFKFIMTRVLLFAHNIKPLKIRGCWFNKTTSESTYVFHNHKDVSVISSVFYINNCKDSGTIFRLGNVDFQTLIEDNTLLFFDSEYVHSCPPWDGRDRYTMAFEFLDG